jgi:hypothetical protein
MIGDGVSFLRKPSFELTDRMPASPHRVLAAGTNLRITLIQDEILVDGRSQVAYGSTSLADQSEADFAFRWGLLCTLRRAPWEPSWVSDRRKWIQGEEAYSVRPATHSQSKSDGNDKHQPEEHSR